MAKKPFKEKYKDFQIDIRITAIKKTGVRQTIARLEGVGFPRARAILDIYESLLPRDKRFKKNIRITEIDDKD